MGLNGRTDVSDRSADGSRITEKLEGRQDRVAQKRLSSILAGLSSASVSLKVLREKEEARNRECAEDERRRLERARTEETQRRLRRSVVKHTERRERAERLRAFIKVVEDRLKIAPIADQEMADPWIDWTRNQADAIRYFVIALIERAMIVR